MPKINPQDTKYDSGGETTGKTRQCGVGDKLLAAVGFERYFARTGTAMLGVRFLCLVDYADSNDEGAICFENFSITEKSVWRIVEYARSVGFNKEFDPEDDTDIGELLTHGYCVGHLVADEYQGKTRFRIGREGDTPGFRRPGSFDEDPEWTAMIERAEDDHREYLDWRAKNPRSSGNGNRAGYSGRTAEPDDDIPF
jgi:hypothetical protein